MKLSVIIPAYNEQATIYNILQRGNLLMGDCIFLF